MRIELLALIVVIGCGGSASGTPEDAGATAAARAGFAPLSRAKLTAGGYTIENLRLNRSRTCVGAQCVAGGFGR